MKTSEIRQRFLNHFASRGHTIVPSASLLLDDPNLLFVNAGMVPFKPYFLGELTPPYKRATSVQKCVRTNDIEEVGKTSRHGSFFQMNGNFSFGDYFKTEAIELAWELITKPVADGGFGFDESKLWVTAYHDDAEAVEIWHQRIGVPKERIVYRGMADNFWSMGVPGPCGPCSEIYIDRGSSYGPDGGPEVDEDRFLEFWNLVFMQNTRGGGPAKEGYEITGELPAKNIDTGMGMERMSSLLQGVDNMYEIDEMRPIIDRACALTKTPYGVRSGHAANEAHPDDVRLRVVADHVRTGMMLIADGVTPGNEGRGYVLRRILRRAIRAIRLLGYQDPAFPELFPAARDCMAESYPELATDFERISSYAYAEEEAFDKTLRAGTTILDTAVVRTKESGSAQLSGEQAFQLHDTYGFPIDLTLEMAAEQGLAVDQRGFEALMAEQRARAKADAAARKIGHAGTGAYKSILDEHGPTDWLAYETLETESRVLALLVEGEQVRRAGNGQLVTVVLNCTPFYAESGGQDSDAGLLTGPNVKAEVLDVQRPVKGLVAHQVRVVDGELAAGELVHAAVDPEWRIGARQAHSGTHVVHAALRQVLGQTALQSGSYNRPGYLRLDFAWRGALSPETRSEIEEVTNRAVRQDLSVAVEYMPLPKARELGALALFGETYDETVRVVEIGGRWSRELCGGTHVSRSAQIGPVAMTGESSVGAGQRRVEAVVGLEAFEYLARERDLVQQLAEELRAPREELPARVAALVTRAKNAEREAATLRGRILAAEAVGHAAAALEISGVAYAGVPAPAGTNPGDARSFAQHIVERLADRPAVVAVVATPGDSAAVVVVVNKRAQELGLAANRLIKDALGGRGGGNAHIGQGGGVPAEQADGLLAAIGGFLNQRND